MRTVVRVLVLAAVLGHGLSGNAYAQRYGGLWEWIDKLSGPGPFEGFTFFASFCTDEAPFRGCTRRSQHWVNLRVAFLSNDESPDRDIEFPDIDLFKFEPSFDTRVHDFVADTFYLELGAAASFLRFGGADSFEPFWEFGATPLRVGLVYWPWDRLTLELRGSVNYLFAELNAADFGTQGDFAISGEWNPSWYVGASFVP